MWEINKEFFSHVSMCICCKSFMGVITDREAGSEWQNHFSIYVLNLHRCEKQRWAGWAVSCSFQISASLHQDVQHQWKFYWGECFPPKMRINWLWSLTPEISAFVRLMQDYYNNPTPTPVHNPLQKKIVAQSEASGTNVNPETSSRNSEPMIVTAPGMSWLSPLPLQTLCHTLPYCVSGTHYRHSLNVFWVTLL